MLIIDYLNNTPTGATLEELAINVDSPNLEGELARLRKAGVIYKSGNKWKITD